MIVSTWLLVVIFKPIYFVLFYTKGRTSLNERVRSSRLSERPRDCDGLEPR